MELSKVVKSEGCKAHCLDSYQLGRLEQISESYKQVPYL